MSSNGPDFELERRRAGVCLHITSLPGARGIGEIGSAARNFLDWMQARQLSIWQFLPTGPTGFGDSPYQPVSVFAGNPLLIDLDELAEWGLLSRAEAVFELPESGGHVDFNRVAQAKGPILGLAADRFDEIRDSGLMQEFEDFCDSNDAIWLDRYTAFSLLKSEYDEVAWWNWPAEMQHSRSSAVAELIARWPARWRRTRLIQYFFARQWQAFREAARQRGVLLFGDVPIYMALDCAEAWAHPELLALDEQLRPLEVAGVPPDYFSEDGQLWGNPVYRWEVQASDGFAWWVSRLKHALARADLIRLDHFRGFLEYWSVPRDATTARAGTWREGPGRALFDALSAALGNMPFVAEDLGVITDQVIDLRRAYALPGMQVLQFMLAEADFNPAAITEDSVCYTGTHDNDTTAGWFSGSDGRLHGADLERFRETVVRNLEIVEQSIHKSMIRMCFGSSSRYAIVPMQDFLGLGSDARLNTPGRAGGNWSWRLRERDLDTESLDYIESLVKDTGRA